MRERLVKAFKAALKEKRDSVSDDAQESDIVLYVRLKDREATVIGVIDTIQVEELSGDILLFIERRDRENS